MLVSQGFFPVIEGIVLALVVAELGVGKEVC